MIKHSFEPIKKQLSGNNYIQIVPSIGNTYDSLVFRYSTDDGDISIHFDAKYKDFVLEKFHNCEIDRFNIDDLISTVIFYSNLKK